MHPSPLSSVDEEDSLEVTPVDEVDSLGSVTDVTPLRDVSGAPTPVESPVPGPSLVSVASFDGRGEAHEQITIMKRSSERVRTAAVYDM
jgi:hypothetical protein